MCCPIFFHKIAIAAVAVSFSVCVANAEVPPGLWKSALDASGMVVHTRTKSCGAALCGRVERVKDRRGYDTPSRSVGQVM